MKVFTIQNETNKITIHATAQQARAVANATGFRSEAALAKLAADWPTSRLIDIWNGLPGVRPVDRFQDRATAVSRIWKALRVPADSAAGKPRQKSSSAKRPGAQVAPVKISAKPSRKKTPGAEAGTPREGSKTSRLIAMLRREGGVTVDEIMTATGWQKHTTRAILSAGGSLTKNHGLIVTSRKVGDERRYSVKP